MEVPSSVVLETNKLESEACNSTVIGCAHIVMVPVISVFFPGRSLTFTVVELDDGNMLVQPANTAFPLSVVKVI